MTSESEAVNVKKEKPKKARKRIKEKHDYSLDRPPNRFVINLVLFFAIITSIGDNIVYGYYLKLNSDYPYLLSILSMIGSMAYILFCFWVVETFHYIRQSKDYTDKKFFKSLLSVIGLALLCEIPFDSVKSNTFFSLKTQNIFFTLTFGFLAIYVVNRDYNVNRLSKDPRKQADYKKYIRFILLALVTFATAFSNCDYGGEGILFIVLLDYARKQKYMRIWQFISLAAFVVMRGNIYYAITVIALIFIYILESKKKTPSLSEERFKKLRFTELMLYPVQLAVIMIIKLLQAVQ